MRRILLFITVVPGLFAAGQDETADSISVRELDEVVVRGEAPQVKGRDGVLVVDLPSIVRDKPVTNILEALGYLPGVTDNNGMIGLNGAASVTIILNGELTDIPVQNLYQLLFSMPVDRLKNVEIMYSAPAEYHVSGAVINVVLKTPRPIDGLTGQIRAGYTHEHYGNYGGGVAATYALKDWSFDLNWSIARNRSWSRQETWSNHLVGGQRHHVVDDMRQTGRGLSNLIYASASYRNVRLTYNGQVTTGAENRSLSDGTFGKYVNRYDYLIPTGWHNLALRYTAPFGLTAGCDYTTYAEEREQWLSRGDSQLVNASNRQSINRYHAYIDRERRAGRWQFNYGVEFQHSDDHSRQHYSYPQQAGFDDVLKEDVADAYVGVRASFDWGLSFGASAKGEYFHNSHQHNWNFVPQLGATYFRTPKSIFQLNFSSQRVYPQYWELHGATSYVNEYAAITGNPALQPYMSYTGQLSYILAQKYVATLYMLYSDGYSVQLPYQLPDRLNLLFQTVNLDYSRSVGLQMSAPFEIAGIWNVTATANVLNKREKAARFHDISFDNSRWIFYGDISNTVKFSPSCPVSVSVDVTYVSPALQGVGTFNALWRMDAGLRWRFGRGRCCELDLKAGDIFGTWRPELRIDHGGQDYTMRVHDMSRNIKMTFIWRFNGFKPKDSGIDTSRFGTGK